MKIDWLIHPMTAFNRLFKSGDKLNGECSSLNQEVNRTRQQLQALSDDLAKLEQKSDPLADLLSPPRQK